MIFDREYLHSSNSCMISSSIMASRLRLLIENRCRGLDVIEGPVSRLLVKLRLSPPTMKVVYPSKSGVKLR